MSWIMIYISMGIIGIYAFLGVFIFLGFYVTPVKTRKKSNQKFISIIVAFRNEEKNLPALIDSFNKLNYPKDQFEIILVNDHSADHGCKIIQEAGIPLIHSPEQGKKGAISFGIEHAKGDWIATTDADCTVPGDWLKTMNETDGQMLLGPVQLKGVKTLNHFFQEFEWAALQSISAGSCFWKMPLMSNGANLSYNRSSFSVDALKKETASGDDIFLLEDFKRKKLSIRFNWNQFHIVHTQPMHSFRELINQKVRWASKSKYYKSAGNTILGILIALVNLLFIFSWVQLLLRTPTSLFYCMVMLSKIMADITFILPYVILTRRPQLVLMAPFFAFAYPFYFIWILILSLIGKYTWKERSFNA